MLTVADVKMLLEDVRNDLPIYFCENTDPWFKKPDQAKAMNGIDIHPGWVAFIGTLPCTQAQTSKPKKP